MDTQKQLNVPLHSSSRARHPLSAGGCGKPEATAAGDGGGSPGKKGAEEIEWYIKLFLVVHFAANWVPVH